MRLLEALLLLSCLPTLLAPFWPPLVPFGWRLAIALTPLAALGAQLALEGPRVELVPGYALVGLVLLLGARRALPRRHGERPAPPRWQRLLARAAAVLGLLTLAAAAALATLMAAARIQAPVALPALAALPPPAAARPGWQLAPGGQAPGSLRLTVVAAHPYLQQPRDLAFNPRVPDELWVVNGASDSVAIIHHAAGGSPWIEARRDGQAAHFMHRPSAIAFGGDTTSIGQPGTFATAQESTNDAIPLTGDDFMGPTLFSSDLRLFGRQQPFGQLGSHLDMLHESPLAMGIAWERANVYWVVGGRHGDITRYDFGIDHGVGNDDHTDGIIHHYVPGQLRRIPGVPSHLAYHAPSGRLFIADTGNGRVVSLDSRAGTLGGAGPSVEPGVASRAVTGAELAGFVCQAGAPGGQGPTGAATLSTFGAPLQQPSGLEIDGDVVFVADHATGIIYAFDLQGRQINALDTGLGPGALMGMAIGPDGRLYLVDAVRNRVVRIDT
jgi:hypothetical protein